MGINTPVLCKNYDSFMEVLNQMINTAVNKLGPLSFFAVMIQLG